MRPQTRVISAVGISDPIIADRNQRDFKAALAAVITAGAVLTYSIQLSLDDPHAEYSTDYNTDAAWFDVTDMAALDVSALGNVFFPVQAIRLNVTDYTSGSVTLTVLQADL